MEASAAGLARAGNNRVPVQHAHPLLLVLHLCEGQAEPAGIRRARRQVLEGACVVARALVEALAERGNLAWRDVGERFGKSSFTLLKASRPLDASLPVMLTYMCACMCMCMSMYMCMCMCMCTCVHMLCMYVRRTCTCMCDMCA